jgi:hypothetical protein
MMKTKHSFYRIGITALALAACGNLAGPGTNTLPGTVRISLGGGDGRTILPGGIAEYYFTLDFTALEKEDVQKTLDGDTTLTVALEPADWTVEVTGYADPARTIPMARGSADFTVTPGAGTACTVYLARDFSAHGTGSLAYDIDLSQLPSSTRGSFSLRILDNTPGTGQEIDLSPDMGGTAFGTLTDLPEGTYLAMVDLYDNAANTAAVWTGVVHIDNGSVTTLDRLFAPGDFVEADPQVIAGTNTLAAKLAAALTYSSGSYTISLDGTETDLAAFAPQTLNVTDSKNITITLRGNGHEVQLGSTYGSLFTVGAASGSSLTLVLQDISLRGRSDNTNSLVRVNGRGILEMKAGSRVTGNRSTTTYGGGVYVYTDGTFTMSGGEVSGNTSSSFAGIGGGVYVDTGGTFTMSGGAVSGNTVIGATNSYGGGVYVGTGGTFTMSGGEVSGNTASSSSLSSVSSDGGGVYVDSGTFTISGGVISGNTASSSSSRSRGGGVGVAGSGTFTMSGGAVSGNTASSSSLSSRGGGVWVAGYATFTMSGGAVSGNTASSTTTSGSSGGGVYVASGTFTMSGGAVSGNTASSTTTSGSSGGGVYVDTYGSFTMSGGEVRDNFLSGADSYGKEVIVNAAFNISGDARPQRVFLYDNTRFITITGPLSGGIVFIDLGITSGNSLTDWLDRPVFVLDGSYGEGALASLKAHFTLGSATLTESPYTEAAITGYVIDNDGLFVLE